MPCRQVLLEVQVRKGVDTLGRGLRGGIEAFHDAFGQQQAVGLAAVVEEHAQALVAELPVHGLQHGALTDERASLAGAE